MNWGLGRHSTARTVVTQSPSQTHQVWCPHVAQGPRLGAKQAQATSLAAPSYASGGSPVGCSTLADDDAGAPDGSSRQGTPHTRSLHTVTLPDSPSDLTAPADTCNDLDAVVVRHAVSWGPDHLESPVTPNCAGKSSSGVLTQHHAPVQHLSSGCLPLAHARQAADRTSEASSSRTNSVGDSSTVDFRRRKSRSRLVGLNGVSSDSRRTPQPGELLDRCTISRTSSDAAVAGAKPSDGGTAASPRPADGGPEPPTASSPRGPRPPPTPADVRSPGLPPRDAARGTAPLTLERLRQQTDALRPVQPAVLQQRLDLLRELLQLDSTACLLLCRIVPGLLLGEPATVRSTWRRLCVSLDGEEAARVACASAPLLLVLPPDRVPACVGAIAAAAAMSRGRAAAFVADWPQLATHALPTLQAKLEGLRALLGPGAGPAELRCALLCAPRLLTFSTAALTRHHEELSALLGPARLRAALRREPGLLLLRPATVAAKLRLLQQLMDCEQHPAAVAALVVRRPGVLRRSIAALSRGCRALSIWQFRRRDKLRVLISRPELLTLPPAEVHGRCRWLRRLMLSNGYYHAALRRLPASLVGTVVAALPQAWSRLQYLAESSQECRMPLMDVVECRPEDFGVRFPEFRAWLQFKLKLMGADNPWRGAFRIRGFTPAARDKPAHDGRPSHHISLRQRQQRQRAMRRQQRPYNPRHQRQQREQLTPEQQQQQSGAAPGPSVPVVMAEACEVRSGGATVSRPRRVLRQPLGASPPEDSSAAATPPPSPLQSGDQTCSDEDAGAPPPPVLVLPPVGLSMAAAVGARAQPPVSSLTDGRGESSGVSISAAAAAASPAAEVPLL